MRDMNASCLSRVLALACAGGLVVTSFGTSLDLADPHVICRDGVYYAYGTGGGSFDGIGGIPVATSKDLVHWTLHDRLALQKGPGVYGKTHFWAPEVYEVNGRYLMVHTANEGEDNGRFNGICVATADSPLGPFKSGPKCPLITVSGSIDNSLFIDDDGKQYMLFAYYVNGPAVWIAEFSDKTLTLDYSTARQLVKADAEWEKPTDSPARTCEGPFMVKHRGLYYLTYSCFPTQHRGYRVCLATAESLKGPWIKRGGRPVLSARDGLYGTGHHSFFKDTAGNWKIAFHAHHSATEPFPRRMFTADAKFIGPDEPGGPWIAVTNLTPCVRVVGTSE